MFWEIGRHRNRIMNDEVKVRFLRLWVYEVFGNEGCDY